MPSTPRSVCVAEFVFRRKVTPFGKLAWSGVLLVEKMP